MIQNYQTILFDLDDTLLDFLADQKIAFFEAMEKIGQNCNHQIYEDYNTINQNLWELLNQGKITMPELVVKRYKLFFEKQGINQKEEKFHQLLDISMQNTGTLMVGVKEVLEEIQNDFECVAITNGLQTQQRKRLEKAGISSYFSQVFISQEIGYHKPDKRFFEYVFQNLENQDKKTMLLVGDSLTSDIQGGINVGIDTCWYNPKQRQTQLPVTYEISKLEELLGIIKE